MSETEAVYRRIFEAAPDGVLIVDRDGRIVEANPAAERLFGYDPGELTGRAVEILVPEGVRRRHPAHRSRFHGHPDARPMGAGLQLHGQTRDGSRFPVEISLSPVVHQGEECVIATVRDVTERNRLRDFGAGALRASEEERQRIARELHDDTAQHLATLLVRLRILERSDTPDEWREAVGYVRDELKACAEGVRRIARGLRPPELEDAGVVAALRAHMRIVGEGSPVDTSLEGEPVDALLPPDARLVLYRVVQEAVSNAIRHSGGERVEVTVRRAGEVVEAEVRDDGKGFSRQEVRGSELRGLGLIGMKERATMVGGQVSIESRPGLGTRVRVEIPIQGAGEVQRV